MLAGRSVECKIFLALVATRPETWSLVSWLAVTLVVLACAAFARLLVFAGTVSYVLGRRLAGLAEQACAVGVRACAVVLPHACCVLFLLAWYIADEMITPAVSFVCAKLARAPLLIVLCYVLRAIASHAAAPAQVISCIDVITEYFVVSLFGICRFARDIFLWALRLAFGLWPSQTPTPGAPTPHSPALLQALPLCETPSSTPSFENRRITRAQSRLMMCPL